MESHFESFEPDVIPSVEHASRVTSGKAMASLALGLLSVLLLPVAVSITLFLSSIALILGIFSLVDIKRNPDNYTGKGLAITGSALSLVAIIAILIAVLTNFLVLFPSIQKIRKAAEKVAFSVPEVSATDSRYTA